MNSKQVAILGVVAAAAVALIWANSPWSTSYNALTHFKVGTAALGLHLNLSLEAWSADGLLAIFFFVVGLELKREFVAGDWPAVLAYQRDPRYLRLYEWEDRAEDDVRAFVNRFIEQQAPRPRTRSLAVNRPRDAAALTRHWCASSASRPLM